jgi:hypothetical protein
MECWSGQTRSRAVELGIILHLCPQSRDLASGPLVGDRVILQIAGDELAGTIASADDASLSLELDQGHTLELAPVPAGHPAHGEFASPGNPTTVWRISAIQ